MVFIGQCQQKPLPCGYGGDYERIKPHIGLWMSSVIFTLALMGGGGASQLSSTLLS